MRETDLVREHTRIGENIRPWLLLMFLALLGVMLIDRALNAETPAPRSVPRVATCCRSPASCSPR